MHSQSSTAFRPALESVESRILATSGLAVASPHPAEVQALSISKAPQAWVKIDNPTSQSLVFQLSANGGSKYYTYQLRQHSSGFYHVNRADSTFLLKVNGETPTPLATGTSRASADVYSLQATISVVPKTGSGGSIENVARFSILNQTSKSSGSGGVAVKIEFSVDGGKTYPLSDTVPYTGGLVPRQETIYYGNQGILYKIPANPSLRPTPLTTFGQYYLFSNTSFQPYLSPPS